MRCCAIVALSLAGCAPARAPHSFSGQFLGTDGTTHTVADPGARLTVIEFFAARCPCQAKHDARLIALAKRYGERGVSFFAIDSELDASLSRDRAEAARRGYPYPILLDPEGTAARAMKADYATYSLLIDHNGKVLFRGGIDSDRNHLTDDATPYLARALEQALAEQAISLPEAKTLGCSLTLR